MNALEEGGVLAGTVEAVAARCKRVVFSNPVACVRHNTVRDW